MLPHAKLSEKAIESRLVERAKRVGGMAVKLTSIAGLPDRLVILPPGRVCFVELKSKGERPRPLQVVMIGRLRAMGFDVRVIDCYEEVDRLIPLPE